MAQHSSKDINSLSVNQQNGKRRYGKFKCRNHMHDMTGEIVNVIYSPKIYEINSHSHQNISIMYVYNERRNKKETILRNMSKETGASFLKYCIFVLLLVKSIKERFLFYLSTFSFCHYSLSSSHTHMQKKRRINRRNKNLND